MRVLERLALWQRWQAWVAKLAAPEPAKRAGISAATRVTARVYRAATNRWEDLPLKEG